MTDPSRRDVIASTIAATALATSPLASESGRVDFLPRLRDAARLSGLRYGTTTDYEIGRRE